MRGVLTPAIKLWIFGSLGGLQVPNFGSVSFILTLGQSGVATMALGIEVHLGMATPMVVIISKSVTSIQVVATNTIEMQGLDLEDLKNLPLNLQHNFNNNY
jgi:hypothetical protein